MKIIITLILLANIAVAELPESDYANPIIFGDEIFGEYGNQWKPKKDKVVIKLSPVFTILFNHGCYLTNNVYGKEYIDYIKTDSKGRFTFKTDYDCSSYSRVKLVCEEDKQTIIFKSNKSSCRKIK